MAASPLPRVRRLCLALPEAHEVTAWGEPTFRVRNKMFATFASASNHHGRGRHAAWVKALPINQDLLVRSAPQRVFVPPYVGPSGWIGLYLDEVADWDEVGRLLRDAYMLVAPKHLLARVAPATADKAAGSATTPFPTKGGSVAIKSVSAKRRPRRPTAKGSSR
jgi:hypothetical protein